MLDSASLQAWYRSKWHFLFLFCSYNNYMYILTELAVSFKQQVVDCFLSIQNILVSYWSGIVFKFSLLVFYKKTTLQLGGDEEAKSFSFFLGNPWWKTLCKECSGTSSKVPSIFSLSFDPICSTVSSLRPFLFPKRSHISILLITLLRGVIRGVF